jgi:hypothetical protein
MSISRISHPAYVDTRPIVIRGVARLRAWPIGDASIVARGGESFSSRRYPEGETLCGEPLKGLHSPTPYIR